MKGGQPARTFSNQASIPAEISVPNSGILRHPLTGRSWDGAEHDLRFHAEIGLYFDVKTLHLVLRRSAQAPFRQPVCSHHRACSVENLAGNVWKRGCKR